MAETEFVIVFAYDVERNSARQRIASILETHATRVQQSVFEARMTLKAAERILARLDRSRGEHDSIRMYVLTEQGRERSKAVGGAPITVTGR